MLNTKQIAVIGSVVALMAVLYSMDIKGLVKKEGREVENNASSSSQTVTVEQISAGAKQQLNANLAQQVNDLEAQLRESGHGDESLQIQKQLAQKWDDVNQPAPAAFYYEAIATKKSTLENWLIAGDRFTTAYQTIQDSTIQPALVQKAIGAYQKAADIDSKNLDAKTGLGVAYVSGTPNPMQGIQLLLEVVKQDPKNVKANMNLGLFSMKSGQFDKAVNRFKTVTEQQQDPEAWFYLASSYENLGQKAEAITAYSKCKELAADPQLSQFVDNKISELKK